jgi:hypothetical protein
MRTRPVEARDLPRLKEIYESRGFTWELPKLEEMIAGYVFVDDEDRVVMFACAEAMACATLLSDSSWATPRWRLQALAELHSVVEQEIKALGFTRVLAFIQPDLGKRFGSRLSRAFGWIQGNGWMHWHRKVK